MLKFPHICRFCLIPNQLNSCIKIFDDDSEIPVKILELTNVKVESGDGLPQEVCTLCQAHLDLSVTFKRQVQKADSMLRHHLAKKCLQSKTGNRVEGDITGDPLSEEELQNSIGEDNRNDSEMGEEICESDGSSSKGEDMSVKGENNNDPETPVAGDPLSKEGVQTSREEDNRKDSETREDKDNDNSSSRWEDIYIKVEDSIVVAEPWPESASEDNCEQNGFEESLQEENVDVKGTFELPLNKIKEENQPLLSNNNSEVESSDDEEDTLSEMKLNLTCTDRIECSCKFCSENKTNSHLENDDSNENQLECVFCLETFKTMKLLRRHNVQVHEGAVSKTLFKCEHCVKCFSSRKGLHAHQRQHNKPEEQPNQTQASEQPENVRRSSRPSKAPERHVVPHYSCSKCERMYSDRLALENHEKSHLGKPGLKCNHCGRKFFNKEFLEKHIQSSHIKRLRNNLHQCNVCGEICENRSYLFSHMRSHKSTVHLCEVCGKTVSLNAYAAHKRSHLSTDSEEVFQCEICQKKFNNKVSLRTHKNSYHGIPKYTCEICGKQFTTMGLMKHHQNIHSGKRDHVCQICGRAFTLKITLKSHMRIHTGETPYKCDNCGRQFTWKTTYRNHVSTCQNHKNYPENKHQVMIPHFNTQYVPLNEPQELPIDYSDEAKYREHIVANETKSFPIVLHLNEEMKYASQQPIYYAGSIKPHCRDFKSPV